MRYEIYQTPYLNYYIYDYYEDRISANYSDTVNEVINDFVNNIQLILEKQIEEIKRFAYETDILIWYGDDMSKIKNTNPELFI